MLFNNINNRIAKKSDFCNCYITLFGYVFIFNGCFENEFLLFDTKNYKCFQEILENNNIAKIIKNNYIDAVNKFYKKEGMKINNESFKEFSALFEESFHHKKEDTKTITSCFQNGNKFLDIGNNTSKNDSNDNDNDMRDVKNEILQLKMSVIEDRYCNVQLLENIILSFEFQSSINNCERKKVEYLENLITVSNIDNN